MRREDWSKIASRDAGRTTSMTVPSAASVVHFMPCKPRQMVKRKRQARGESAFGIGSTNVTKYESTSIPLPDDEDDLSSSLE